MEDEAGVDLPQLSSDEDDLADALDDFHNDDGADPIFELYTSWLSNYPTDHLPLLNPLSPFPIFHPT